MRSFLKSRASRETNDFLSKHHAQTKRHWYDREMLNRSATKRLVMPRKWWTCMKKRLAQDVGRAVGKQESHELDSPQSVSSDESGFELTARFSFPLPRLQPSADLLDSKTASIFHYSVLYPNFGDVPNFGYIPKVTYRASTGRKSALWLPIWMDLRSSVGQTDPRTFSMFPILYHPFFSFLWHRHLHVTKSIPKLKCCSHDAFQFYIEERYQQRLQEAVKARLIAGTGTGRQGAATTNIAPFPDWDGDAHRSNQFLGSDKLVSRVPESAVKNVWKRDP